MLVPGLAFRPQGYESTLRTLSRDQIAASAAKSPIVEGSALAGLLTDPPSHGTRSSSEDDAFGIIAAPSAVVVALDRTPARRTIGCWSLRDGRAAFSAVLPNGDLALGDAIAFEDLATALALNIGTAEEAATLQLNCSEGRVLSWLHRAGLQPGSELQLAALIAQLDEHERSAVTSTIEGLAGRDLLMLTDDLIRVSEEVTLFWPAFGQSSLRLDVHLLSRDGRRFPEKPSGWFMTGPAGNRFHVAEVGAAQRDFMLLRAPTEANRWIAALFFVEMLDSLNRALSAGIPSDDTS